MDGEEVPEGDGERHVALVPELLEVADGPEVPLAQRIARVEKEMKAAAKRLEFEEAAMLRDRLKELRELQIYAG